MQWQRLPLTFRQALSSGLLYYALNLSEVGPSGHFIEWVARLTLAIGLMALRVAPNYFRCPRRAVLLLLVIAMPAVWLSAGLLTVIVLGLSLSTAMLVGAVVTPTNPVLAGSAVTGG